MRKSFKRSRPCTIVAMCSTVLCISMLCNSFFASCCLGLLWKGFCGLHGPNHEGGMLRALVCQQSKVGPCDPLPFVWPRTRRSRKFTSKPLPAKSCDALMPSALKAVHVPKRHMRAKQRVETEESCVKQIVVHEAAAGKWSGCLVYADSLSVAMAMLKSHMTTACRCCSTVCGLQMQKRPATAQSDLSG